MRGAFAVMLVCGCGARTPLSGDNPSDVAPFPDGSTPPLPGPSACPGPFGPPTRLPDINTSFDDLCARLSPDELTMWFTSDRGDPRPRPDGWDLYVTTRTSKSVPFGSPQRLANLASNVEDGCPSVTGDGRTIFFQTRRTNGKLEIWSSTRSSTSLDFPAPTRAVALVPNGWESWNPYVLPTPFAIYLSATEPGQAPHLHRATSTQMSFTAPIRIDSLVEQEEQAPVVTPDELSIYFTRAGTSGGRDFDIVLSMRASRTASFPPDTRVNELSTTGYEFPNWISPDGCRLYFTAERSGGLGRDDIWFAERGR